MRFFAGAVVKWVRPTYGAGTAPRIGVKWPGAGGEGGGEAGQPNARVVPAFLLLRRGREQILGKKKYSQGSFSSLGCCCRVAGRAQANVLVRENLESVVGHLSSNV